METGIFWAKDRYPPKFWIGKESSLKQGGWNPPAEAGVQQVTLPPDRILHKNRSADPVEWVTSAFASGRS
jgi:hypothetical protein